MSLENLRNMCPPAPPVPSAFLIAGTRIGEFVIERVIGVGGMGIVYLARQDRPRRWCAVKVLQHQQTRLDLPERFKREVDALGQLNHPAIATILAAGVHSAGEMQIPFFAMELLEDALPINQYCITHQPTVREVVDIVLQICDALALVHRKQIVHRDLKPNNILVLPNGRPKIIDFGIAALANDPSRGLTMTGSIMGAVRYMSPEQLRGAPPDVRSDIFSLAVVLYELFCGVPPFTTEFASSHAKTITAASTTNRTHDVPQASLNLELYLVICRALEFDAGDRYVTVETFAADLRRFVDGETPLAAKNHWKLTWKKRSRRTVAFLTLPAIALSVLLAHGAGQYGGWYVDGKGFGSAYAGYVLRWLNFVPNKPSKDVRIIRLTETADYAALAARLGTNGFDPTALQSLRLLHAHAHDRLRQAGAKTIAWDIVFSGQSKFDTPLVEAWKRATAAGAVPIAARSLRMERASSPVSVSLQSVCQLAAATGEVEHTDWKTHLAIQRDTSNPVGSFALSSYLNFSGVGNRVRAINPSWLTVDVSSRDDTGPEVPISVLDPSSDERPDINAPAGSLIASIYLEMPPRENFVAITHDYDTVLLATDAELRSWFSEKLVVIGDGRPGKDGPTRHGNGQSYYGFEINAQTCDQLINGYAIRSNAHTQSFGAFFSVRDLIEIVTTLLGAGTGWRAGVTILRWAVATFAGAFGLLAAALLAYQFCGWLASPAQGLTGFMAACLLLGTCRRVTQPRF